MGLFTPAEVVAVNFTQVFVVVVEELLESSELELSVLEHEKEEIKIPVIRERVKIFLIIDFIFHLLSEIVLSRCFGNSDYCQNLRFWFLAPSLDKISANTQIYESFVKELFFW